MPFETILFEVIVFDPFPSRIQVKTEKQQKEEEPSAGYRGNEPASAEQNPFGESAYFPHRGPSENGRMPLLSSSSADRVTVLKNKIDNARSPFNTGSAWAKTGRLLELTEITYRSEPTVTSELVTHVQYMQARRFP